MIDWKFELDAVEIDAPVGFDEIVFNIQRDDLWHGVFIEASTSKLGFYGAAYTILKDAKENYGVDANIIFTASSKCDGQANYTEAISGKLNFSQYEEKCGNECIIEMSVEQDTCAIVFKNRFDQKVNIDSNIAFDKQTLLPAYTGLGLNIDLATQVIPISADGEVDPAGDLFQLDDPGGFGNTFTSVRPIYAVVNDNSIRTAYLNDPAGIYNQFAQLTGQQLSGDVTPQVLLEENPDCITTAWHYSVRLKGTFEQTLDNGEWFRVAFGYWDGIGDLLNNLVPIEPFVYTNLPAPGFVIPFDETFTGTIVLPDNVGVYALIQNYVLGTGIQHGRNINFDPETSFLLYNDKQCPPTDCDVYLINETLARVTESLTDSCLSVKSDYYGRTDSQPYTSSADGCGGLRILTPGLKIRQAVDKEFFASMEELITGLRAIDNIGMGMEANTFTNLGEWLRIEPAEYFYQDIEILEIASVPNSRSMVEENRIYSNIKTGYNNWEIKSTKGIDEFCSYKERRTGIKSVNNSLDISSDLIASGYIIENLRTSTLVDSGETDNTYDNDVFIICVERGGYNFIVEQGIAENAANFYSPSTAYNWRIRPMYNLMRWFKSIVQCYVNISNTTSKIFFTSAKGNYLAEGNINAADACVLENKVLAENDDLGSTDFLDISDATPIYMPETLQFTYPLSIADYISIKNNPYGYINVQCGNGNFEKAFIKSIEYHPAKGDANFILIKKWQ